MESREVNRKSLKSNLSAESFTLATDQKKKVPPPPLQKHYPADATLTDLVAREELTVGTMPLLQVINRRKSRRKFTEDPLTLEELSFLLWATQGVRQTLSDGTATRRTVPSAGSRHPFETYLLVNRITGLEPGLYRYLPLEHKLCFLYADLELVEKVNDASWDQVFVGHSAAVFFWTAIPYRTEWRYSITAPKLIALDAGHLCQNLYLASEAIGAGTCAIGTYDQDKVDAILGVDGKDEFTIYLAPVGRIR